MNKPEPGFLTRRAAELKKKQNQQAMQDAPLKLQSQFMHPNNYNLKTVDGILYDPKPGATVMILGIKYTVVGTFTDKVEYNEITRFVDMAEFTQPLLG